jgi:7-cyano-7-deazaguanine reductase
MTGQPDFHLVIDYAPRAKLVKQVAKTISAAFATADFHGLHAGDRPAARQVLAPRWLRIGGYWYPRGGMPIDVFWQTGQPPKACGCPTPASPAYRGRGWSRAMSRPPPVPKRPPRRSTPAELPTPSATRRCGSASTP